MKQFGGKHLLVLLEISVMGEKELTIPEIIHHFDGNEITEMHIRTIINYLKEQDILQEIPTKFGARKYKLDIEKLRELVEYQITYQKIVNYLKTYSILIE